jgi:nucleotide-binding universal stress UspA family protein
MGAEALDPAAAPRQIDGFTLGEVVHSSAMASIFRVAGAAAARPLGFPAIIKLPRIAAGEGASPLLGFQTESLILPVLASPHVPRFGGAGDIATNPYLVIEWIEGTSLERIVRKAPLAAGEVARLGAAVADALHSIHRQDTIHHDLKPENVIIRPSGEAVLIDFGMAHHARLPDLLAEQRRSAAGSAPYVSPEQVSGIRSDLRSDLFALGVMLYEMATGKLPFGAPQTVAGLRDRLWLDPAPPRQLVADVPHWLQQIICGCLEPAAAARYQSAAHVAFDLRHPEDVALDARAYRQRRAGVLEQLRRWWKARSGASPPPGARTRDAPVVMVAVDTTHPEDPRHDAIRGATERVLSLSADFRLICVSVVHGERVGGQPGAPGIHLEHLVRLQQWVAPLALPAGRVSLHVMEAFSASATLLEFARNNHVDLIVIGGPAPEQQTLAWWRSVASGVTANAACSVLVVRNPADRDAE